MAGFLTTNTANLIRTNLWSRSIKELLLDDLNAMNWVRILSDFPDGITLNIPSIGEATTFNYVEGQAIKYEAMATGNFTFEFDTYLGSAHAISEKFIRDSYYSSDVISAFVPREHRAIMEAVETNIFSKMNSGQAASSLNTINNAYHRWVGQGTGNVMALPDLAAAKFALIKANVPLTDLVGIIDPTVAYTFETQTNLVSLISPNPMWNRLAYDGSIKGFKFQFNIAGFDLYISNYLPAISSETVNGVTVTNGSPNFFFSAAPGDTQPIIGAFRQMPTVYSEFNKDQQQTEYLTIAEWGFKLYRPENLVSILTSVNSVVQP